MNYTEENILKKAEKIILDINPDALKYDKIEGVYFNKEKELARGDSKNHPCWTVSINTLFDNKDFLTISDETGEPLYYQNFNMLIAEIEKDSNGKYVVKK